MLNLKTATIHDDYKWIWADDEAIDKDREDWESEYEAALESADMSRMPLRQGVKPTVFTLRHPTPTMRRYFAGFQSQEGKWFIALRRVVQLSVVNIEDAGLPLKMASTDPETLAPALPDATMDVLEEIERGALVNAIANFILSELRRPS